MEKLTYRQVLQYLRNEQKMQLKVFKHVMSGGRPTFFAKEHQEKWNTLEKLILLFDVLEETGFAQVLRMARGQLVALNAISELQFTGNE